MKFQFDDIKLNKSDQTKISSIIQSFTSPKVKPVHPGDLKYYLELVKQYDKLQDYSGHLKWFREGTSLSIDKYPRHKLFFDATAEYRQVLFQAGNRIGKSEAGGYCSATWATGIYSDFWNGKRFDGPTDGWIAGDTNQTVRDVLQVKLLGPAGQWGTGMLPKDNILDVTIKPNSGGAVDTILVRHEPTGKKSRISFKQYQQGAASFYGTARDWIWLDEEPIAKDAVRIIDECRMRLMTKNGVMIITFTPLHGITAFLSDFKKIADNLTDGLD